jgi:hypothetical protein
MYNTDSTLYMSEGELMDAISRLRGMIKRIRERANGGNTEDLEWDLCYVQRELDLRASRTAAHARYLESRGLGPAREATPTAAN